MGHFTSYRNTFPNARLTRPENGVPEVICIYRRGAPPARSSSMAAPLSAEHRRNTHTLARTRILHK